MSEKRPASSQLVNPYLAGRREWNERYGDYIARAQSWRAVAILALLMASLARWIADVRSVYTDAGAQRTLINEGYAFIDAHSDAFAAMNDHMRAHNPFERAQTETVSVSVESVLAISENSWRIEWREETRTRDGREPTTKHWQAQAAIAFNKPDDEKTLRLNPLGIYVTAFNWSERL